MKHRKIHIVGGPGSGKTYYSRKLSQEYGIPSFDLDDIFWDKSQRAYVRTQDKYRNQSLDSILEKDSWIIEGVYYKWLAKSFRDAEVIVILKTPLALRQWRIFKRFLFRKFFASNGKEETFSSLWEMVLCNRKYDRDNLVRIHNFLEDHKHKVRYCKNYNDLVDLVNV